MVIRIKLIRMQSEGRKWLVPFVHRRVRPSKLASFEVDKFEQSDEELISPH